jgi:ABC-2 type transport system permease protein
MGLRGDRRTLALVLVAPVFIIFLFSVVLDEVPPRRFNVEFVKPVLLGFFAYFLTYLLAAIGFLRERQSGTLERVFASPVARSGLVLGYMLGFGVLVAVQSAVLLGAGIVFLDVAFEHGIWLFFLVEVLGALSALGLGILVSMAAHNEFQVMQFVPLVIAPQVILGGVFVQVSELPVWAEAVARVMPLTYLLEAMYWIVLDQGGAGDVWRAVAVLAAWTVGTIILGSVAVRRGG